MEFLHFIRDHFWHAFPILVAVGVAIAIAIERSWSLYIDSPMKDAENFFEKVAALVMKAQFGEAVSLCEGYRRKPMANILHAALTRAHLPESVVHDGIQLSLQ